MPERKTAQEKQNKYGPIPRDPYAALGVSPNSTKDQIRRAYKTLSQKYHPDQNPGDEDAIEWFRIITEARDILMKPNRHSKSDQYFKGFRPPATGAYRPGHTSTEETARQRQEQERRRQEAERVRQDTERRQRENRERMRQEEERREREQRVHQETEERERQAREARAQQDAQDREERDRQAREARPQEDDQSASEPGKENPPPNDETSSEARQEEEKAHQEAEDLPRKERERMAIGLNTIGFVVEKKKNNFFAGVLGGIVKKLDKKGTAYRFCEELRSSFVRDAETAQKKAEDVISGKEKHRLSNTSLLFGNIVRYGRVLSDVTGASLASPLRYVMMGGMAFTRASEAGKEARLKNEEVIEKTRITDADQAAEEAWTIYENARAQEGKTGNENVSTEALKNAYLMEIPENIWKRFDNPSVVNSKIQKILRKDINLEIGFMLGSIDRIEENKKLSPVEKKQKKEALIKKWEKKLVDYDRILTQYGTVDELAMAGRYAQTVGKAVVALVTVETLFLSAERLWETLSHALSGSDTPDLEKVEKAARAATKPWENLPRDRIDTLVPTPAPGVAPTPEPAPSAVPPPATPEAPPIPPAPPAPTPTSSPEVGDFAKESFTFEKGKGGIQGILDLKNQIRTQFPDISKAPQGIQDFMKESNVTKQAMTFGFFDPSSPKESAHILEGSTLHFDDKGNLIFHDARTGEDVMKYSGKMFDSDKSATVPEAAPIETPSSSGDNLEEARNKMFSEVKFAETPETYAPQDRSSILNPDATFEPPTAEELRAKITAQIDSTTNDATQESEQIPTYYGRTVGITGNPLRLEPNVLNQVDKIYTNNLSKIFQSNSAWHAISGIKARTVFENGDKYNDGTVMSSAYSYLSQLKNITGLKPQGNWLLGRENTEHYIARALQFAAKSNLLAEVQNIEIKK